MKTNIRDAMIALIRESMSNLPLTELAAYVRLIPLQVAPGASEFDRLGQWFQAQIILNDISVAYELHQLLLERQLAADQSKGALAPGGNSNGRA